MFPIETYQRTLGKATGIFRQHGIRFHLTGGVAAVYYAEPRLTQDLVWVSKGSSKSRRDVRQMFRPASEVDRRLIRQLSDQLGLGSLLQEVLAEREDID